MCLLSGATSTWSLPQEQKDKLRADITGVLKSAKVPKQNITRQERTALKGLQKEKSITILPADKGKATFIMETREYQEKMKEMLNDEATYEKLKKDPTKTYKAELIRIVKSLEKEGKITKDQYWYLYPTLEKVPRMYGAPKIHKEGVPLRPIVDYTHTITYRVSRELANILQKLQQHMKTVDPTGSIIFTREDEENNSMPFLDAKFTRKEDGSVKSTVYRKKTHTDQYLNFASHHPKHQKLGVVRTLMHRCETITSEEGDKKEEVEHLREALRVCGYPSWALNKVTDSCKKNKKKTNDRNYRSQVVIPSQREYTEY